MFEDPIIYSDKPGYRVLDLRPDGITCISAIGISDFSSSRHDPELHYHAGVVEFCLCLKGNLTFTTNEREYRFLPGHLFASTPNQPHSLKNNPKGLKTYRLLFAIPKFGNTFLGLDVRESEWLARSLMNLPKRLFASTPRVKTAFDRIFDLYDHARPSPARRVRMKSAALELLTAIVDAARRIPSKTPSKIDNIATRIRENPEADYPVANMAREAKLSLSAFSDVFKRSMGLPLHAYVINSRIRKAKTLLETTKRSIESIAEQMRFKSKPHFALTFKRIIGISPYELRKSIGSKNPKGLYLKNPKEAPKG